LDKRTHISKFLPTGTIPKSIIIVDDNIKQFLFVTKKYLKLTNSDEYTTQVNYRLILKEMMN